MSTLFSPLPRKNHGKKGGKKENREQFATNVHNMTTCYDYHYDDDDDDDDNDYYHYHYYYLLMTSRSTTKTNINWLTGRALKLSRSSGISSIQLPRPHMAVPLSTWYAVRIADVSSKLHRRIWFANHVYSCLVLQQSCNAPDNRMEEASAARERARERKRKEEERRKGGLRLYLGEG